MSVEKQFSPEKNLTRFLRFAERVISGLTLFFVIFFSKVAAVNSYLADTEDLMCNYDRQPRVDCWPVQQKQPAKHLG